MSSEQLEKKLYKLDVELLEYAKEKEIEEKRFKQLLEKNKQKKTVFINKLIHILSLKEKTGIKWSSDGNDIEIYDQSLFQKKILEKYFKHIKISSFIRQLNIYEFERVKLIDPNSRDLIVFRNRLFSRGSNSFHLIKRKKKSNKEKDEKEKNNQIIYLANQINEKLNNVQNELCSLKQERCFFYNEIIDIKRNANEQKELIKNIILYMKNFSDRKKTLEETSSQVYETLFRGN